MKTAWNILAIVAIANMLGLAAVVGWLYSSDRMNKERATAIRVMVAKTITQEKSEAQEAQAKADADKKATEEAVKSARAPLTAFEKLAARGEATEIDRQRAERLKREVADLQSQLARDMSDIARQRAELESDRETFNAMVNGTRVKLNDAQYRKTLNTLASLKPAQAVALFREMLTPSGAASPSDALAAPNGTATAATWSEESMTTVVGYLDAMGDDRSKVIGEFLKTDPPLAAELLERLRTRATFARVPRNAP